MVESNLYYIRKLAKCMKIDEIEEYNKRGIPNYIGNEVIFNEIGLSNKLDPKK